MRVVSEFSACLWLVSSYAAEVLIGCTGVLLGDGGGLVAVAEGIEVGKEGIGVEDGLRASRATTIRAGREVMRKNIRDGAILAEVEAQVCT